MHDQVTIESEIAFKLCYLLTVLFQFIIAIPVLKKYTTFFDDRSCDLKCALCANKNAPYGSIYVKESFFA